MDPIAASAEVVLKRAVRAGVRSVIVPAYDLASWEQIARLALRTGVHAALGLHPWCAQQHLDATRLKRVLLDSKAVAIGEVGLDFAVDVPAKRQLDALKIQLELAVELDLPVILHCRKAFEALLETLSGFEPSLRGVLHAFSRGPQLAQRFLQRGLYLGFGGALTRSRATKVLQSAQSVPLSRILLETDAPSMGLEGVPPEQTEPRHIVTLASRLAVLRGIEVDEVAWRTTQNARELFGIA